MFLRKTKKQTGGNPEEIARIENLLIPLRAELIKAEREYDDVLNRAKYGVGTEGYVTPGWDKILTPLSKKKK
jgi:hypothetical protein